MKRIIEGATYNTETATAVAEHFGEAEDTGATTASTLYHSRTGVYFHVDEVTSRRRDRNGEVQTRVAYEWYVVGDAAKAREWCERHDMTIMRDIEDMPPEAEVGEKLATLYVRLSPTLKDSITSQAEAKNVSANVYALRCLEECEARNRGPNAFWNAVGSLEQFQADPEKAWNPVEDAKEWGDRAQGWREFRLEKLKSLIGKLERCRDSYPG